VHAVTPDGNSRDVPALQEAPGRYVASVDLPVEGTTLFSINSPDLPDGGATFGHTRSYPREFLSTETNESLLRRLAEVGGGSYDPAPASVWKAPAKATSQRRELTDYFLIAALLLIPVDIYLRRRA
jgi:hypothetical protein